MGLMDIDLHAGYPLNPNGPGATTVMNGFADIGDLPGIMKYVFSWVSPMHIISTGETQITLKSISDYPELLAIHPGGDINNFNWFIVEYLTGTNNNFGYDKNANIHDFYTFPTVNQGGGLRIWRITMDPDFFIRHEINPWDTGMIYEPYFYFEAVHEQGSPNHFFYPGDSFTPQTILNSNYPLTFTTDGQRKKIDESTNSGIYLENIRIENGTANFTVTIRKN